MPPMSEDSRLSAAAEEGRASALAVRLLRLVARRGDLVMAAMIVAVIALLVVPLPTPLLDGLIALNLAASLTLLMLSLYVPSAPGLSTLPTLLLLTTLFRLSLNIASTKLILLNGAAGHIIDTFGRMVVGGNVVVGLVVFLIIAIVQFIVIAKGAERVAEVGARFSLDGLPGKQMSVDADLRAGLIDKEEAQRRRRELEEESKLYGALDGAMKFVKGDAIAGLLIAFVNIIAGITIGVTMRGMSASASIDTYSVLSVGDGMVAQIPSLFVSIAAGILITRVDSRSKGRETLGMQIAQQMLAQPTALMVAAALVATFLLVPGLPSWPFVTLATLLAVVGYLGRKVSATANAGSRSMTPAMQRDRGATAAETGGAEQVAAIATPLRLRVAATLRAGISLDAFDTALASEKLLLAQELGLPFPGLQVNTDDTLTGGQYWIDVQEMRVARGDLHKSNVINFGGREAGAHGDGTYEEGTRGDGTYGDAETSAPGVTVSAGAAEVAEVAGGARAVHGSRRSREPALAAHIAWVVRRHAEAFIGIQETHELLARAAVQLPELAAEAQKAVPLQRIAEVLRRLVQEGVSIRYLREICESLVAWGAREKDIVMLTEYVRVDLGRFIVPRYLDAQGQLRAIVLDADAERALQGAIQQGPGGSFLALSPETAQALLAAAESALAPSRATGAQVILAPMGVRRYLKKFLASRFPTWAVLSFQELPGHVQVQAVGRLALQASTQRRPLGVRL
jgi:type III secretion protein V